MVNDGDAKPRAGSSRAGFTVAIVVVLVLVCLYALTSRGDRLVVGDWVDGSGRAFRVRLGARRGDIEFTTASGLCGAQAGIWYPGRARPAAGSPFGAYFHLPDGKISGWLEPLARRRFVWRVTRRSAGGKKRERLGVWERQKTLPPPRFNIARAIRTLKKRPTPAPGPSPGGGRPG